MIQITPIPAFSDNYLWLIHKHNSPHAVIVDPGDATPVLNTLRDKGLELGAILVTHNHSDHVGGIRELLAAFPGIPVYGPGNEPVPCLTRAVSEGERIILDGLDMELQVLDTPGHTRGHIAWFSESTGTDDPVLFCGDTIFSAGCGRVFNGTFEQLHDSLQALARLPASTQIYCAHEYTLDNIGFAEWVEPDNTALQAWKEHCWQQLDAGGETIPSRLETERQINPFLRTTHPDVIAATERHAGRTLADSRAVFRELRTWKDREYD